MLFPVCAGLMIGACIHDIISRTIPNSLALAVALLGVGAQAANNRLMTSVAVGGTVFLLAALCWRRGWIGGGDVKLLGGAAMVLTPELVPLFIAAVAISGGLLALLYIAVRTFVSPPCLPLRLAREQWPERRNGLLARVVRVERWRIHRGCPLPYACAITAGFFLVT